MEAAVNRTAKEYSRYGSAVHKQVYIYGGLDMAPTEFVRNFGMAWGMGGWLLFPFLQKIGPAAGQKLRARVAAELKTTFASHYAREISLAEALQPDASRSTTSARPARSSCSRRTAPVLNGTPMSYMLLIVEPVGQRRERTEAEGHRVYEQMLHFADKLKARGVLRASESLGSGARRLQKRDGRQDIVDGPFAEAKEMVGGFFLLDTASEDEALAIAAECPARRVVQRRGPPARALLRLTRRSVRGRAHFLRGRAEAVDRTVRHSSCRQEPRRLRPATTGDAMRFMIIVKATPDSEAGGCRAKA
jgi:hypothetical protein